jgi:DNA-directed RNA polymerase specialized sigma24 family protein
MDVKVECERRQKGWKVSVPALDNLEILSKRLDVATEHVKDLIQEKSGVERCNIVLQVETSMPGIMCEIEEAQALMREAERVREQASADIRAVVTKLREQGLSMRDIAVLMQVSPQRVAQLAS